MDKGLVARFRWTTVYSAYRLRTCVALVKLVDARREVLRNCLKLSERHAQSVSSLSLSLSLSLSFPVGGGCGSPPQSVPGSSRGVAGRLWRCLLASCPSWRDRGPDTGTPDARRRCGSVGRWPSPGAQYCELVSEFETVGPAVGEARLLCVESIATYDEIRWCVMVNYRIGMEATQTNDD